MKRVHRIWLVSASLAALGLWIGASQASAFTEEDGVNAAGALCMNPADAAESTLLRSFCDSEILNALPVAESEAERQANCRDFERACLRRARNARDCHVQQINTEGAVLARTTELDRRTIREARRECRRAAVSLSNDERRSDAGNCTANLANDYVANGGRFGGNINELPGVCAPGFNCRGIVGALNECIDCRDFFDFCTTASVEELAVTCGNIGLCVDEAPDPDLITNVFCEIGLPNGPPDECLALGLQDPACLRPGEPIPD